MHVHMHETPALTTPLSAKCATGLGVVHFPADGRWTCPLKFSIVFLWLGSSASDIMEQVDDHYDL